MSLSIVWARGGLMDTPNSTCTVCGRSFKVRFRYQVQESSSGKFEYFCSQACQQHHSEGDCTCVECGSKFSLEYAFQLAVVDRTPTHWCSTQCRSQWEEARRNQGNDVSIKRARRIAVFNHKGGTAKTTTAVNLAAGIAERGLSTLIVDADGQGNVGASLGISGEKSLYHVLVQGLDISQVAIPVRENLDVITSNATLASAEIHLASLPNRHRIMRDRLSQNSKDYDVIVIDCAPALSLMNQNALFYADSVVVPVGCDYLSLLGVKQVLQTLKDVRRLLAHDIRLLGVLPTFFDRRNRISVQSLETLQKHFGERCLPPIRVNTRLREAPSARQTIFEFAPQSNGASDYAGLVQHIWETGGLDGVRSKEHAEERDEQHVLSRRSEGGAAGNLLQGAHQGAPAAQG